jgi:hypothetical protein
MTQAELLGLLKAAVEALRVYDPESHTAAMIEAAIARIETE